MESDEESLRLDIKIDSKIIKQQALWAGLKPGMRVADIGCGPGRIASILNELVQPGGSVVGVDNSQTRLEYANQQYAAESITYYKKDILDSLDDLGKFDFVWSRFVLEYYLSNSFDIVKNISSILKPGGTICLIDLDQNPLNFHGMSSRLEKTFQQILKELQTKTDFDPFAGRRLYSYLFDLGYENIDVDISIHNLIFGKTNNTDTFNLLKKVEIVPKKLNFKFEEYDGGYDEFYKEVESFLVNPRIFAYTPLILCKGVKPKI
ncbi:MAG: methyltransferase domain-containing protein [Cyclobacteriaceae bacterium]|nr:methyltransferase domain-containing protein [Cyclobacteriaceae bacterium]